MRCISSAKALFALTKAGSPWLAKVSQMLLNVHTGESQSVETKAATTAV